MTKQELLARLRFEVPVEIDTPLDRSAAVRQLRAVVRTTDGWMFWKFFDGKPIRGFVEERGGNLSSPEIMAFYPLARTLVFGFETSNCGTRMVGVLRLRPFLQIYGVVGVVGMIVNMIWMTTMSLQHGGPSLVGTLQILQQLGLIPFIWLYLRICIWLSRKKEAKLLEVIRKALEPLPETPSPGPRVMISSTPTEVFIRPRHESPERMS